MSLPALVSACNATVNPPTTTPNPHGLEPSNAFQMERVTDAIKAVEVRRMTGNALLGISVVAETPEGILAHQSAERRAGQAPPAVKPHR